jgi:hypothetical protein
MTPNASTRLAERQSLIDQVKGLQASSTPLTSTVSPLPPVPGAPPQLHSTSSTEFGPAPFEPWSRADYNPDVAEGSRLPLSGQSGTLAVSKSGRIKFVGASAGAMSLREVRRIGNCLISSTLKPRRVLMIPCGLGLRLLLAPPLLDLPNLARSIRPSSTPRDSCKASHSQPHRASRHLASSTLRCHMTMRWTFSWAAITGMQHGTERQCFESASTRRGGSSRSEQ